MIKFLELKLKSPLSISSDRSAEHAKTLDYIPGSVLRGCIASLYIKEYGEPDDIFNEIFLNEKVTFGHLYPAGGWPIPKTAESCKRWKGFKEENTGNKEDFVKPHGVFDKLPVLALRWITAKNKTEGDILKANGVMEKYRFCPTCEKNKNKIKEPFTLEPIQGFYGINDKYGKQLTTNTILLTRTGISRTTGNVEHGILFNIEALQTHKKEKEGIIETQFAGFVRLDKDLSPDAIVKLENILQIGSTLRLGVAKSRGLGNTEIVFFEDGEERDFDLFKKRMDDFNNYIHSITSSLDDKLYSIYYNNRYFFTTNFHSDVILLDRFLRYRTGINSDDLGRIFPQSADSLEIIGGITDTFTTQGWNNALGLPKADEIAIKKGSVILLSYKEKSPPTEFFEELYKIEEEGIGIRRGEGYGRVIFSDSFHTNPLFQLPYPQPQQGGKRK